MKSSSGARVMSASEVFSRSMITNPSRIALFSVFFIVVVGVYWRSTDEGRRSATILSTFPFSVEKDPAAELPKQSSVQSTLESPLIKPPVRKLVEALRREVLKVERNTGVSADTGFDLEKWKQENPCLSRTELPTYYSRLSNSPSRKVLGISETSQWETVLYEYGRLHRVCIRAAGNLTEYFQSRNTTTGCKFFIGYSVNGLGNKFFIMAPSILYAILTYRVVLIPEITGVPDLVCEPFPGSTWRVSDDIIQDKNPIWNRTHEFMENVDKAKQEHESTLPIYASRADDYWLPVGRCVLSPNLNSLTSFTTYLRKLPTLIHAIVQVLLRCGAVVLQTSTMGGRPWMSLLAAQAIFNSVISNYFGGSVSRSIGGAHAYTANRLPSSRRYVG